MKIAVKDNLVVLASKSLEFKEGILKDKNTSIINLTPDTCEIYDNITLPDNFRVGCFTYINGVFEATPELQARLDAEQAQQEQALLEQKQALLDSIEPLQQRVFTKNSDVLAIKFQDSENDDDLTNEEKKANKDLNKKVIKWRKKVRQQNNNITITNTLEEIQARIDRINELDELFPEIER